MAEQDAAIAALCEVLTRLSRRTGLTVDRLRTTEVDVAPLLSLPVIHHHAHRTGVAPHEVATAMVRAAARGLPPTDRLIADAVLRLGLLRKNPPDTIDLDLLYAPGLNARRAALLTHWTHLHEFTRALHTPPPPATRALRARSEPRALTALAHLLVTTPSDNPTSRAPGNGAAQADSRHTRSAVTTVSEAQSSSPHLGDHVTTSGNPQPGSQRARDIAMPVNDPQPDSRHAEDVVARTGDTQSDSQHTGAHVIPSGTPHPGSRHTANRVTVGNLHLGSQHTDNLVTPVDNPQPGSQHARRVLSVDDPQPDSRDAEDVVTTTRNPHPGSQQTEDVVTTGTESQSNSRHTGDLVTAVGNLHPGSQHTDDLVTTVDNPQPGSRQTWDVVTTVGNPQPGSQQTEDVVTTGTESQSNSRHTGDVVTTGADPQAGSRHMRGVVTVVGEAVLEHIYRVDQVPPVGSSTTGSFQAHPGGKGLSHAVAAARLGLEVRLVTAVGDDDAGRWIRDYLRSEDVGTELVRVVPQARTPVTAVMVTGTGAASTIGCREERVRSGVWRLGDAEFEGIIAGSDAVLLTFDQPMVELERVLTILRELESPPVVVMQPSPRIDSPQHLYRFLRSVDYLVGTRRQLARMLPEVAESASGDPARRLRSLGVRAVCEISDFGCTVDSEPVRTRIPPFPAALRDSPGAHSAFAAALMRRVITSRRPATEADFRWATAAMVAAQSFGDAQEAMPSAREIDRIVRLAG